MLILAELNIPYKNIQVIITSIEWLNIVVKKTGRRNHIDTVYTQRLPNLSDINGKKNKDTTQPIQRLDPNRPTFHFGSQVSSSFSTQL